MTLLPPLAAALAPAGLNAVGVVPVSTWDARMPEARKAAALCPGARSIIVFGNGGRALWDAFLADLRRDPHHLTGEANPLDAFVRRAVVAADPLLGETPRRWFYASADADVHIDFRVLAQLGGLGTHSRMGLLLHPRFGLWLGLRAAVFLAADLPATAHDGTDPCDGCPAPCVSACPGGAMVSGRWDVERCGAFHREADTCERSCAARIACPVGEPYSREEMNYHSHRASGRRWLREHLGIPDEADPFEGIGPHWGDWKTRVDVKGAKA